MRHKYPEHPKRWDLCHRACEGIDTGVLEAVLEGGSTLKTQFEDMVAKRQLTLHKMTKASEDLKAIRAVIQKTCCTALMDKTSVLSNLDAVIADLDAT